MRVVKSSRPMFDSRAESPNLASHRQKPSRPASRSWAAAGVREGGRLVSSATAEPRRLETSDAYLSNCVTSWSIVRTSRLKAVAGVRGEGMKRTNHPGSDELELLSTLDKLRPGG